MVSSTMMSRAGAGVASTPMASRRTVALSTTVRTSASSQAVGHSGRRQRAVCQAAAGTEVSSAKADASFMFLDAETSAAGLEQPLPVDEMIAKAKSFLSTSVLDVANLGELMAEDFRFVAPVVGPLSKKEFLAAFGGFNILEAFPDLNPRYHHFRMDPDEPGRVWFSTTAVGTHTGTLAGNIEATGIEVRSPPQTCSVILNKDGKVTKYTVGYVNDKELGNTGGLGGIFGIFYAVGSPLPFPEANPWKKSKRYAFFQWLGQVSSSLSKKD